MPVQLIISGEDGVQAAHQLRQFIAAIIAPPASATAEPVAEPEAKKPVKKAAKPAPVEDDEDDVATPAPKAKAKKPVVEEDEEEEAPAPKKKAAKPAPVEEDEEEEEAPAPKAKAKTDGKSSVATLVDDGKEQPATVDGCRIMVRRVARASGSSAEHAQAVLAEFGVDGATKVPPKKFQAFIDRCQEVIDDPETIEIA